MSDWEEEIDSKVVFNNNRPKMAWGDEEDDDEVKESWDDSEEEEETPVATASEIKEVAKPPPKKNMTLKEKIAEKEAFLKEQKKKKIALANRVVDGETEEERFERAQKEAGAKRIDANAVYLDDSTKKEATKPVESCKPRTTKEFEEFQKLLTDLILPLSKNSALYATFLHQFAKDISEPAKDMDIRKAASSLTALANQKGREQKEALKNTKKGKGKNQPTENNPSPSTREYSTTFDDFDDFM